MIWYFMSLPGKTACYKFSNIDAMVTFANEYPDIALGAEYHAASNIRDVGMTVDLLQAEAQLEASYDKMDRDWLGSIEGQGKI